ncbi:MAG: hypothetical protein HRT40_11040 [Campylobacteraceae bacterium]|nr:hypothetical protein [Campylobacteraceae bacterium]
MRRGARQSQIINNFFSLATIILVTIVLVLYVKYIRVDEARINSGLECQKDFNTSDEIISQKLLNIQNKLISQGKFILDGGLIQRLEFRSNIKSKIRISQIDKYFLNELNVFNSPSSSYFVRIKYDFIENEDFENDYVSRLEVSFRINAKESFKMKTDIMSYKKEDIKNRINCVIKAFKQNVTRY